MNLLRNTWHAMINRCCNQSNPAYYHYGERGIEVCERWLDSTKVKTGYKSVNAQGYLNFLEDMKPTWFPGATIDRIDNDGDYTPENCQWVTRSENIRKENQEKLDSGTHHLSSGEIQQRTNRVRVENGTHNFLGNQQQKGKVNVYDVVLGRGYRVTKDEYLAEKNVRYFATNSKIAKRYRDGDI